MVQNRETVLTLESKITGMAEEIERLTATLMKTETSLKFIEKECSKLRQRYAKLKSKRFTTN